MKQVYLGLIVLIGIGCGDSDMTEPPLLVAPDTGEQRLDMGSDNPNNPDVSMLMDMNSSEVDQGASSQDVGTPPDMVLPPDPMVNSGWIGGPCTTDGDCAYDGGYCLTDTQGFPRGMCTLDCDGLCPDQDGMPVTFCASDVVSDGACVQRCDSTFFGGSGCRPGYRCESRDRFGEPPSNRGVCVPGTPDPVMMPPTDSNQTCLNRLTELGIQYRAASSPNDSPDNRPDLTCDLDTPVYVSSPIGSINYLVHNRTEPSAVFVTCYFARALLRLSELLEELNVVRVGHIGTYNCRVISGTDQLSEHGKANAIDLKWFETTDGRRYDVEDHWEHGKTRNFDTDEGEWLYELGQEMFRRRIFNIILTPEFNAAHDNHFHVDLTPGSRFIENQSSGYYIGPNVHGD